LVFVGRHQGSFPIGHRSTRDTGKCHKIATLTMHCAQKTNHRIKGWVDDTGQSYNRGCSGVDVE
jgi:hypothetical protein